MGAVDKGPDSRETEQGAAWWARERRPGGGRVQGGAGGAPGHSGIGARQYRGAGTLPGEQGGAKGAKERGEQNGLRQRDAGDLAVKRR